MIEVGEYATLEWIDWYSFRRLLEPIGNVPPAKSGFQYFVNETSRASKQRDNSVTNTIPDGDR